MSKGTLLVNGLGEALFENGEVTEYNYYIAKTLGYYDSTGLIKNSYGNIMGFYRSGKIYIGSPGLLSEKEVGYIKFHDVYLYGQESPIATYDGEDIIGAAAAAVLIFQYKFQKIQQDSISVTNKNNNNTIKKFPEYGNAQNTSMVTSDTVIDNFLEFLMKYIFISVWIELIVINQRKPNKKDFLFTFLYFIESILLVLLCSKIYGQIPIALIIISAILVVISMYNNLRIRIANYNINIKEILKYGILGIINTALRFLGVMYEVYGIYSLIILFGYIAGK